MSEGTTALQAVAPSGRPRVRIDAPLIQVHRAPWWVLAARLLVVAVALLLPLHGALVLAVMLVAWFSSAWVVRYPVDLPAGRMLFEGGLSHSQQPGRHWLRPRRSETAYSIALEPLRIDWRPAPTRLQGASGPRWLDLSLALRVRPRDDEVGQFVALLQYQAWHDVASSVASSLRREVIGALVAQIDQAGLAERGRAQALAELVGPALEQGLSELGLVSTTLERCEARLGPRTEDLSSEDWVLVEPAPPADDPAASPSG